MPPPRAITDGRRKGPWSLVTGHVDVSLTRQTGTFPALPLSCGESPPPPHVLPPRRDFLPIADQQAQESLAGALRPGCSTGTGWKAGAAESFGPQGPHRAISLLWTPQGCPGFCPSWQITSAFWAVSSQHHWKAKQREKRALFLLKLIRAGFWLRRKCHFIKRHRCTLHLGRSRYKEMSADTAPVCPESPVLTVCPGRSCSPPEAFQNTLDCRRIQSSQTHLWNTPLPTPARTSRGCPHCLWCWARAPSAGHGQPWPSVGTQGATGPAPPPGENSLRPGRRRPHAAANGPEVRGLIKCHLVKVTANTNGDVKIMVTQPAG